VPKYVIERALPGAGTLPDGDISEVSKKSNGVLDELGDVQWLQSYVATDKLFCVYIAPNEDRIREHARLGEFPVDEIHEVVRVIDPTTGGR
jgi:hypothetical protein